MSDIPETPGDATPPPPYTAPNNHASGRSAEERQWAMFAHLSALVGGLVTAGWAASLGCIIGPLVIWMMKKETMPFVDDQGKEALNFNITVGIVFLVLWVLTFMTLGIGILLTGPLMLIVGLAWLVVTIIAAIKANEGVAYRYPFALRLVK
ncbi:hypothetical protein GCM10008101_05500 [Lysobacter xinjiangensis]|uniref:Orotate phosphoribosyltransferase n=1 Tax=Cognatilysobacter xinjiangensis TaxID=546892 RepID=A0ABQ3BRA4_9GAMM|nr:DUF4870 domain-containing protein [Lysobacter xinjiangensis]GGZ54997.1 hypothetical protein GCM10008101_05500 [Lysobacter xinjiangensis]